MAKRHVEEYFKQICDDYHEMLESLHDLEIAVSENAVSPERFDELKQQVEAIKTNYMRWSYVMFLLDMPNKESKAKNYQKQVKNQKKNKPETASTERLENKQALKQFKENITKINEKQG